LDAASRSRALPLSGPASIAAQTRAGSASRPRNSRRVSRCASARFAFDSETSAYGRLRRALDTGNARIALAAAADLPQVGLADALELLLLLLDLEPARFERAALRWHGRYCREVTGR
jgi:hypothetical protein